MTYFKTQTIQERQNRLTDLEQEAYMYYQLVASAGVGMDPLRFSHFISQFLHTAGKLRKLRIKLGIPNGYKFN